MPNRITKEQVEQINFFYFRTNMTMEAIADRMGISHSTVRKYVGCSKDWKFDAELTPTPTVTRR